MYNVAIDALQVADPILAQAMRASTFSFAAGSRAIPCTAGACNCHRAESLRQWRSLRRQRRRGAVDTCCLWRPPCWRRSNPAGHKFSSGRCRRMNRDCCSNRTAGRVPEAGKSLTFPPPFSGGWPSLIPQMSYRNSKMPGRWLNTILRWTTPWDSQFGPSRPKRRFLHRRVARPQAGCRCVILPP